MDEHEGDTSSESTEGCFLEMLGLEDFSSLPSCEDDTSAIGQRVVARITVPSGCSRYHHRPNDCCAFQISGCLEAEECSDLIQLATALSKFHYVTEATHVDDAGVSHTVKLQQPNKHKLSVFEHEPSREKLWRGLEPLIADQIDAFTSTTGCGQPIGLNPRLRVLRYDSEDKDVFDPHFDATTRVAGDRTSLLTVLLYLNDGGGADFEGGQTLFLDSSEKDDNIMVTPSMGSVVVFEHDLFHSSAPLEFGTKYVLRTDVLFAVDTPAGYVDRPRAPLDSIATLSTVSELCDKMSVSDEIRSALDQNDVLNMSLDALISVPYINRMLTELIGRETATSMLSKAAKYKG